MGGLDCSLFDMIIYHQWIAIVFRLGQNVNPPIECLQMDERNIIIMAELNGWIRDRDLEAHSNACVAHLGGF